MSYCRFSSADFGSDVYVFEDVGGDLTTHVAGQKIVPAEPLPDPVPFEEGHFEAFFARDVEVQRIIDKSPRVPIGMPHDGATFNDPDPGACADRLEALRELGYRVPGFAIEALREEAAAEAGTKP